MNSLLVVGGASIDDLLLKDRTVTSAGGAGMYTAMAARRCGVQVAMFYPHSEPSPVLLRPVAVCLTDCPGPLITQEEYPRFEISYRRGKTEYLKIDLGAQDALSTAMLPDDLSHYDLVHVIPVGAPIRHLDFIRACRQRGARRVSAGTFPGYAEEDRQGVYQIINEADYFFMNKREATAVFGSLEAAHTDPGKVLFVTLGKEGACIVQGDTLTCIPAVAASELDPTGAGDTFCGATLAFLLQKEHPIMAARRAVALAAEMIAHVGPTALMSDDPPPEAPVDSRVRVNEEQVCKVAARISTLAEVSPFPFTGPEYPPVGHPRALDYFFAATLQQFSFWSAHNGGYERPMIAPIGGVERKGSDYLWAAYTHRLDRDPDFCSIERQAHMKREEMLELFRSDDGQDPMPAPDLHLQQARGYGRDMLALNLTPQLVLERALASSKPLRTILDILDHIGGYKEDPLRKKPGLLALILDQRPEKFLPLSEDEQIPPVLDYHLMRSALRTGLIDVVGQELHEKIRDRRLVTAEEEWEVRYPAYQAIEQVVAISGKPPGLVDMFFFSARKRCPEMSEPQCEECHVNSACAQRKELFQPVLRTTYY